MVSLKKNTGKEILLVDGVVNLFTYSSTYKVSRKLNMWLHLDGTAALGLFPHSIYLCISKVSKGNLERKKVNILKRSYNLSAVILPWVGKERQILVNQRIVTFKSNSITLKFNLLVSFFQKILLYIQFFCHLLQ